MTGSTEHALGAEHLAGCFALSKSANWNQSEADWRLMLAVGHGWGITASDGALAASTLVIPFEGFAWVSMVLVLPEHRRKGYATRLLRVALADLRGRGLTPILDATPAGREVYRQEGFRDTWTFKRFSLKRSRPAQRKAGSDPSFPWDELLRLDREAFGASRERLLRDLARRLPEAARVVPGQGFVLGREGREAQQIGPLVARDEETALRLLQESVGVVRAPLYVDVVDHAPRLQEWLQGQRFEFQRPFTRMVHGAERAPGNESLVYCVAGPELG